MVKRQGCEHEIDSLFRRLFCLAFCCGKPERKARVTLGFDKFTSVTFEGDFMATVTDSGGPLTVNVSTFVDAAGNPVNDTDIPVYTSSMPDVATVAANDPAGTDPQGAVITLTKKLTDPAAPCVITADFKGGAGNAVNGGFTITGQLNVIAGAAVGAQMVFGGPGLVPGA
jgi:hypothetical protein